MLTGVGDGAGEDYRPIQLAEAPTVLVNAVLASEDHRFFEQGALDVRAVARAAWSNVHGGRVTQGGSTITQQLVKNRLLTHQRTILRKLQEAWLAILVESSYPKAQILEAYLNEIYLGQRGPWPSGAWERPRGRTSPRRFTSSPPMRRRCWPGWCGRRIRTRPS